jgi:hypothetical protein
MALYEKGHVRIHYEEAGSGFPLFVIPGGGQNSTIGFMSDRAPFNVIAEFKDETTTSPSWITWASGASW